MSDTLDLLAELNAEFGKAKKPTRAKGELSPAEKVKLLNKAVFTTPTDEQSLQQANAISKREQFQNQWKPVAREVWLMRQRCDHCGYVSEFIAGEYIRFQGRQLKGTLRQRAGDHPNEWYCSDLPYEAVEYAQDVERCVHCVMLKVEVDRLFDHLFEKQPEVTVQDELIVDIK